jgi:hypothetical protein
MSRSTEEGRRQASKLLRIRDDPAHCATWFASRVWWVAASACGLMSLLEKMSDASKCGSHKTVRQRQRLTTPMKLQLQVACASIARANARLQPLPQPVRGDKEGSSSAV